MALVLGIICVIINTVLADMRSTKESHAFKNPCVQSFLPIQKIDYYELFNLICHLVSKDNCNNLFGKNPVCKV